MEYVEADPESYPMLVLLELGLSMLAGNREEVREHFRGRVVGL